MLRSKLHINTTGSEVLRAQRQLGDQSSRNRHVYGSVVPLNMQWASLHLPTIEAQPRDYLSRFTRLIERSSSCLKQRAAPYNIYLTGVRCSVMTAPWGWQCASDIAGLLRRTRICIEIFYTYWDYVLNSQLLC